MSNHPLDVLFAEIKARKGSDPAKSYTAKLLQGGPPKIAKKLGEEAAETIIAALVEDKAHFVAECADVLYHLLVLIAARDATPKDVYAQLIRRRAQSGLDEKASRKTVAVAAIKAKAPARKRKKAKA
ncbi:MAG: phosphoribosyl-ATP diphosphatase [Alphaproteobacteria bacterium]|mgnify:FL=1|nr:phosphoribosyl-ATP diphosphatase [Alphaproteobacteria bacterium]